MTEGHAYPKPVGLILKRQQGEAVVINGGQVVVRMLDSGRGWARIGFLADVAVPILREELVLKQSGIGEVAAAPVVPG